jgi:hypothetical protein
MPDHACSNRQVRRALAAPAAALLLVLAACDTASNGALRPPPSTPAPPTSTTSTHRHREAAWAPDFGPINPNTPPDENLYRFVAGRDCDALIAAEHDPHTGSDYTSKVYGGLGHACKGEWAAAAADARAASQDEVPSDSGACYVKAAAAALNRLVQAYQAGGGQPVDLVAGPRLAPCSQTSSSSPSSH